MWKLILNLFAVLILTSCSTLPIEMKSLISIVGFDLAGDKVKITALLKNANVIGKTQNSSKQNEKPSSLLKIEGQTIDYATHQASRFVPRHIDWNHLHMVIISEDAAKRNLSHILDFFARHRNRIRLLISLSVKVFPHVQYWKRHPNLRILHFL